jgi:O-antigen ligase
LAALVWVLHQRIEPKYKWLCVAILIVGGGVAFYLRFAGYFEKGATSASARFSYWRVAVQVAMDRPLFGSGPGTFQRPYALAKPAAAEMSRLVHNDYLQQASDAGWVAFAAYAVWVGGLLWFLYPRSRPNPFRFALWLGFASWCAHSFFEFSLYIPALAWTAFTLAGILLGLPTEENRSTAGASPATQGKAL